MLSNTGSWSVGDFIPDEPGQHPDWQTTLYKKNRASMLLYNTGSWSEANDFIPEATDAA